MKWKVIKEVAIQALTEEDLENIGDQVKEVTDDVFQRVTHQQEEMHRKMQEQMVELRQFLEATRSHQYDKQRMNKQQELQRMGRQGRQYLSH
jgi:hypothetical protein